MNGHRTPRHTPAGPRSLSSRRRRLSHSPLLLVLLLLTLLLGGSLLFAGCGSDGADAADTSAPTTAEPTTTSAAATTSTVAAPTSTTAATEAAFPVTVTDDNGASVTVEGEPMRIVSTAPASTETLFALGLGDRVVGVTSLCDYPAEVESITKIGDFMANTEAIMALSPDLVVGYSGNEEALAPIQAAGAAVIIFNPATVDGIYSNITTLGAVTGKTAEAAALIESIKAEIADVAKAAAATGDKPRVFYGLDNTLWTCGPGSFVDEMLSLANCANIGSSDTFEGVAVQAYYQLTPEQLVAADPDVILLPSSSGYSSAEEFTGDPRFAGLTAVKDGRVYLFDDTTVTRPGARVGQGLRLLAEAIHPGAF
ncbi:MAG: ABC transporter substrate-binding protein [Thermoleophilia bacterium]|nr:ABC transporter substrate-binding protein [Thermoleophilia bacterium]